jgi:hypothetical protein
MKGNIDLEASAEENDEASHCAVWAIGAGSDWKICMGERRRGITEREAMLYISSRFVFFGISVLGSAGMVLGGVSEFGFRLKDACRTGGARP